jgi:hypothetical protein
MAMRSLLIVLLPILCEHLHLTLAFSPGYLQRSRFIQHTTGAGNMSPNFIRGNPPALMMLKGSLQPKQGVGCTAKMYSAALFYTMLPNIANAISSDDASISSKIPFVAKCVLTFVIFGLLISLFIPPKITTVETLERPVDQEKVDSTVDDIIRRKSF